MRTPRMEQLEALLQDDPKDPFLRYGLALEYRSAGDMPTAAQKLLELLADTPYVPGYLMAGQVLQELGRAEEAIATLRAGIDQAREQRNTHAEGEMTGLLATME